MPSWTTRRRRVREGRRRRTGGKTTGTGAGAIGREERITTECWIITLLYNITLTYEIVVVMNTTIKGWVLGYFFSGICCLFSC